jgi:hypothetical protein
VSRRVTGESHLSAEAPARTTSPRDAARAILIVLAVGLALRLILAYLLPGSGFRNDLDAFRFWASNLADQGPYGFYERGFFADYTPGYLYVLWLVGAIGSVLGGIGDLIKVPAILADLALAWLVWSMVQELGGGRRAALLGAILILFNPITWFDSVVWGQVDSVGVVFLLLAARELWRDRLERSAVLAVIAAVIKPQLGILVPIVAAVTIRRALFPSGGHGGTARAHAGGEPDPQDGDGRGPFALWRRLGRGPGRIVTTGLAGLLTAILLAAPFKLSIFGLLQQVGVAAGGYPWLTVNAYNPWALLQLDGQGLAVTGSWVRDITGPAGEAAFHFGPIPAVLVGTLLLLASIVAVTIAVARRPDRLTIVVGLAVLALVFFVVPTRVHERYLFPFFPLAAILAAISLRWRVAFVVVSAATFLNMYVVLTTLYPNNPSVEDWLGIGPAIRSQVGVTVISLVHLAALGWAALQLRHGARARLAGDLEASRQREEEALRQPATGRLTGAPGIAERLLSARVHVRDTPADPIPAGRSPAPHGSGDDPDDRAPALPTWTERPSIAEVGAWGWFRSRLADRPVRPDRSAALVREGGGRLDRLDLWIVVVLILVALTGRTWRLAEPYRMHFDEVYHARTATEFLQHWRYGISHDIYEWTHPHLAKYAIAGGIVAFAGDRVSATSDLGVPVRDAVIEPYREEPLAPGGRSGGRLYVATGTEVRSYDLATRRVIATTSVPGASAVGLDPGGRRLFVGTEAGALLVVGVAPLDALPGGGQAVLSAQPFGDAGGPARQIHVTSDGRALAVLVDGSRVVMVDGATGEVTGTVERPAISQLADAGRGPALVASPGEVEDAAAVAGIVEGFVGGESGRYAVLLGSDRDRVVLAAIGAQDNRAAIDAAIADGRLPGVTVEDLPRVAFGEDEGITLVIPAAGQEIQRLEVRGGVQGMALVTGIDDPKLYATTRSRDGPRVAIIGLGSSASTDPATMGRLLPLPGEGSRVLFNQATQQVHVLGAVPADRDASGQTIYVIEPHANAVFADTPLPFSPVAVVMDAEPRYPSEDRQQLLALGRDGTVAAVEAGGYTFGWRIPGVLAGVAMAALLYLLARILFRRRAVAVAVAGLTLFDGMLFAQSRIAMNDAYVGVFILAAYTLFAGLWMGSWRWRGAFWVVMPTIGVLLGLALASKWVAAYAIGALGILVLVRSALGRLVLIAGLIVVTTVLGYIAVSVPEGSGAGNLTFMLIMIGLTLAAVVVNVVHPIAWSREELRIAVGTPALGGVAVAAVAAATGRLTDPVAAALPAVTFLAAALALGLLAVAVGVGFWLVGRWGFGPLAAPPDPDDPSEILEPPAPPSRGWLRPGASLGLPVAWMLLSLLVIPVAIYVASYVPWAMIENHRITESWPPGHTGQTLVALTGDMYRYHNTLTAAHAASSPWWAWPFNLKPVWFYQDSFAGGTSAAIYNSGNLVIWWLSVPAMIFCAWQAFRRRSLALALIAIAFACQWIPWARIDRAAFQYHYYTSLPFVLLGLGYFLAELWHGASRRTWLLARLAAAAAIVAPALLYLFHRPLCWFVDVEAVNPGSRACPTIIPDIVITARAAGLALIVGLAVVILVRQLARLGRPSPGESARRSWFRELAPLAGSAAAAALALVLVGTQLGEVTLLNLRGVSVEPVAILLLLPLGILAAFVATARNARRFVLGTGVAIVATFAIFYPNISGLPLPSTIFNAYQGILPTYLYPFQFPVSTVDRTVGISLFAAGPAALLVALVATCVAVGYSTWVWRITLAERRRAERDDADALARGGSSA